MDEPSYWHYKQTYFFGMKIKLLPKKKTQHISQEMEETLLDPKQ